MSTLIDAIKLLLPPAHDASKRHVHSWRWIVVIAILALLTNAVGGRGYLPFVPAYAQASDVQVILELQYAEVIRGLHEQVCNSAGSSKVLLQNTLEEYQRRYRELTGKRYPLSACMA